MAVHLIFQSTLSDLIESLKLKGNPSAVWKYQAVEADYQALLVNAPHRSRRANDSRTTGDKNPLPVGGVKRNGHRCQHRTGEVTGKLSDHHRLQKRAFIDSLEAGRV